jgi:hypothetical protein
MPDGIVRGLKKAEEEVVAGAKLAERGIEAGARAVGREAKHLEEEAVAGAKWLGREAKEAEEKAVSFGKTEYEKLKEAEKGLAEGAKAKLAEWHEQRKFAGEYEREYVPKIPISPEEREAKIKALLTPKRPLTELLGVKKEDGVYKQMELPCQQKFKCQNCEYYAECTSPQKVRKPKTEEEHIDEFFGGGWDDLGKGWERLG